MRRSAIAFAPSAFVSLVFVSLVFVSCSSSSETTLFPPPAVGGSEVLAQAAEVAAIKPLFVESLDDFAVAASYGYALALGRANEAGWEIDLRESTWAAERLALGLLEGGVEFERLGQDGALLRGPVGFEDLLKRLGAGVKDNPKRRVALGAVAEVGGNVDGLLATPASEARDQLVQLSLSLGIAVTQRSTNPVELRVEGIADHILLARLPVTCEKRLPIVGGTECSRPQAAARSLTTNGGARELWVAATTGPLGPNPALDPASIEGGVSWNNNEAQAYRPSMVEVDDGFVLIAEPRSDPDVFVLPYTSGMVLSTETYGFGTYVFDFMLPEGEGLWPALWLLDSEACENPGRCAGYLTSAYHEIDLLETRGSNVEELFTSVHWWDEQIRSDSSQLVVDGLGAGNHTIELDRFPGLLVWRLDGVEVARVGGLTKGDGVHRSAPMRIVANLAVGGSFAGDDLVGRDGGWWGDAKVPASFPDVGWTRSEFAILDIRFTPLL